MYWKIWIIFERTEIYSSNFKVIYKDLSKQNLMGQNNKIFRYLRYLKIFCIIWNLNIEFHFHPWFVAFLKILILCIQLHTKTIFKYVKGLTSIHESQIVITSNFFLSLNINYIYFEQTTLLNSFLFIYSNINNREI